MNCVRILTRILPYIFEDPEWRGFFWSTVPGSRNASSSKTPRSLPEDDDDDDDAGERPLAEMLINAISDLLFCPDFTVAYHKSRYYTLCRKLLIGLFATLQLPESAALVPPS